MRVGLVNFTSSYLDLIACMIFFNDKGVDLHMKLSLILMPIAGEC